MAHAALDAGISVVPPMEDGTKRPMGAWKLYQSQRPTIDQVKAWYGQRTGLGFVTGTISGDLELFELDADFYAEFREAADAVGLGPLIDRIEAGYLERSPSGGWHLLYRCKGVRGNTKLAQKPGPPDPETGKPTAEVLIETRGEGGYVVVAPSNGKVHPSGGRYELLKGGVEDIATISEAERDQLWALARTFDQMPVDEGKGPLGEKARFGGKATGRRDGPRPGDDYNARASWDDLLTLHGWKQLYTRGETTYWRRPGKSEGWSATTNHNGSGLLWVFSTSTEFDAERSYDLFGAYAVLEHGGSFEAAAKCLGDQGYGSPKRSGRASGRQPPTATATANEPPSGLPEIVITTDEFAVNNQAIAAMTNDHEIFCRGNYLVTVQRDAASTKLITRPPETPRIAAMQRASIRERISKNAYLFKLKKDPDGDGMIQTPTHPPDWTTAAIEARGHWPGMRPLEGVIEAPIMLSDGSILDKPGYDHRSGLLYEPNCEFPPIPSRITRQDAAKAARELLEVVADFPFAVIRDEEGDGSDAGDGGVGHQAAFLAGLLTPLARYAIAGPCPLFLVDANVAASGKSKLCDIVAILATGRTAARSIYPESNEEMEKRIISIALEGDRMILLDNIATGAALGGAALDAALTATTVKGRLLGRSEMSREIPIYTVWYATGNNLGLKGDALRRVVPCRLESPEERPEERKNFRIKGDLLDYVRKERGRLVVAALTILRGYVLAGRPVDDDLTPMDYPAWCGAVRHAVHWAIGVDPCRTRIGLIADDPETNLIRGLFEGWAGLPRGSTGHTTAEVVRILTDPEHMDRFQTLRDVLLEWSKDGGIPSPKSIGRQLRMFKGKVVNGKTLKANSFKGTQSWRVVDAQ